MQLIESTVTQMLLSLAIKYYRALGLSESNTTKGYMVYGGLAMESFIYQMVKDIQLIH